MLQEYFVGQRVIYSNSICKVLPDNTNSRIAGSKKIWIFDPEARHERCVSIDNVKPLPGDQL